MGSLKTKWKSERMFCKTPCQRTSDCEIHDWGGGVPLSSQNSMLSGYEPGQRSPNSVNCF